jgi:hypothetical protein
MSILQTGSMGVFKRTGSIKPPGGCHSVIPPSRTVTQTFRRLEGTGCWKDLGPEGLQLSAERALVAGMCAAAFHPCGALSARTR